MREIKFRAWDKSDKIWLGEDQFVIYPNGTFCAWVGTDEPLSMEEVALMQFTGLKDKNGKEIYEGDIIKYPSTQLEEIKFMHGCFCRINYKRIQPAIPLSDFHQNDSKIIGNVYENPELLAATNEVNNEKS
jgi:uncharacterized phage protein (TIGR01671 family)